MNFVGKNAWFTKKIVVLCNLVMELILNSIGTVLILLLYS